MNEIVKMTYALADVRRELTSGVLPRADRRFWAGEADRLEQELILAKRREDAKLMYQVNALRNIGKN